MFYNHDILTSREHGVATIWLVATLGSKSTTNKVNRRAILDVDVPHACGMIIHPEAPMALRLQSNLLYGISKVYSQQCGYALLDAQNVKDRMWTMLKTMKSGGLDPEAGKARPDQLVLTNDPKFIPELMLPGLNVDMSSLEMSTNPETPRRASLLSSYPQLSSKAGPLTEPQLRLNISSSEAARPLWLASEVSSAKKGPEIEIPAFQGEETGVLLQPDFEIDEEGNIVELPAQQIDLTSRDIRYEQGRTNEVRGPAEIGAGEDFYQNKGLIGEVDIEMRDVVGLAPFDNSLNLEHREQIDNEAAEIHVTQMQQRKRAMKTMELDDPPELRNSDLAQWNSQYAQNMAMASKLKEQNKILTVAKKNATYWVLGIGIASVGAGVGASGIPHPLEVFSGQQLLGALTGKPVMTSRRRKRKHDEAGDGRNVRQRAEEGELGRGDQGNMNDAPEFLHDDIEIGREAPPSLHDDHSSQMPWNITASAQSSRQGSALGSRRGLPGAGHHSAASSGADGAGGLALGRRRGRLTSASPLAGRGAGQMDTAGTLDEQGIDLESLDGMGLGDSYVDEGIEGHHASPGKQQVSPSWLSSNLDKESLNFFTFVMGRLSSTEGQTERITFSSLFPPKSNSPVVATQAFLHVLTLATSGAVQVHQKQIANATGAEDARNIYISLSG